MLPREHEHEQPVSLEIEGERTLQPERDNCEQQAMPEMGPTTADQEQYAASLWKYVAIPQSVDDTGYVDNGGKISSPAASESQMETEDGAANSEDPNVDASPGLQDETGAPFADEEKNWYFHGKHFFDIGGPDLSLHKAANKEALT
jgi:hypothetical protein